MQKAKKTKKLTTKKVDVKARHFIVFDPIFSQKIHVFVNTPIKKYYEFLRKFDVKFDEDSNYALKFGGFSSCIESKTGPPEFVIFVNRFDHSIASGETLIHEIVHTMIKIWDMNHIPYDYSTQEFMAWTIGNIWADIIVKLY